MTSASFGIRYSIVIPVFNREAQLSRAIKSARNAARQTREAVEIVVIDDASSDNSAAVARDMGADKVVRLEKNLGASGAKNAGIEHAQGEWLVFLDSDDELTHNAFIGIESVLSSNPAIEILFGACVTTTGLQMWRSDFSSGFWPYEMILKRSCPGEFLPVCHRRVFGKLRFSEALRGFEGITWLCAAREGRRIYYTDQVLRIYDATGEDRLCAPANQERNFSVLALGFRYYLSEFGSDMALLSARSYLRAALRYHWYSRCAGLPHARISAGRNGPVQGRLLEVLVWGITAALPTKTMQALWRWRRKCSGSLGAHRRPSHPNVQ
ncbi:MAG: glycosyltransferase family 2 protein [Verrucomicrobiota bacterium]